MIKNKKIVILFSGEGSNLSYILEALHKKELEVVMALTNNINAKGINIAKSYGVPVEIVNAKDFSSREAFDAEVVKQIEPYAPDLTVLAGFMRILTPVFTENIQAINLHPSLLPRHKGLRAIENSFEDAYDVGGITIHHVTSDLDGGEVIVQREISKENFTLEGYTKEVKKVEKIVLAEAIKKVLKS